MHWIRFIHVTAVIMWVGALMMHTRLLVDAAKAEGEVRAYLAQRCYRMYQFIQMPMMWVALTMGLILISSVEFGYKPGWFHMKMVFIVGMILTDVASGRYATALARGDDMGATKKFHIVHGAAALCLIGVLISLYVVRDRVGEVRYRFSDEETEQFIATEPQR